jgi:hypothetical protein
MVTPDPGIDTLVEYLKQVPPVHLQLIDLAWDLVKPDGTVDLQQVRFRMEEVMVARAEAAGYARATHDMMEALLKCAS